MRFGWGGYCQIWTTIVGFAIFDQQASFSILKSLDLMFINLWVGKFTDLWMLIYPTGCLDYQLVDCFTNKRQKIVLSDIELDPIIYELNIDNRLFNFCVGVSVGRHPPKNRAKILISSESAWITELFPIFRNKSPTEKSFADFLGTVYFHLETYIFTFRLSTSTSKPFMIMLPLFCWNLMIIILVNRRWLVYNLAHGLMADIHLPLFVLHFAIFADFCKNPYP